ncbi:MULTISPECIES: stage III sporulation protein AA [Paenibacillus]|uniref:Stage III sporulation protein AA n=2 Tax=Paenibacillus TaxID=44249 RepID=A0AAJ2JUA5_9BACL|nr:MULTISPECIES: stage III sporulation protein AA [Paenibacillus]EPY13954.1 stage III sporulation protein AA [Paenibacillus alvei A6-6i-x]MCM3289650.1 stage III sporulation protein AA [Paenibacillus sp. MER 180]MCY9532594.1 stage III sporulation protein AA [Paenibacillus alvei]MDT8975981.1 stage III sporulation protein AA [Paenibacillus sp. chi10]OBY77726.1 stage III sporulation protein AA [Paenibacillus sp. KS1]
MNVYSWSAVLPPALRSILLHLPERILGELEEVRIRQERPLEVSAAGEFYFVTREGTLTDKPDTAYRPNREDSLQLLDYVTNHSLYTMEEELRRGFITVAGGHRIGLAGRTVLTQGRVSHLRDITGFNLRIAREVMGIADDIIPQLLDFKHRTIHSTLVVSPPQHGKTTLLRDMARAISSGCWNHPQALWKALKVGIVDERSEIAGCTKGVPSYHLGYRTDVIDGCPKAEGLMMFIRSMSPDVLVVDEFGREEDYEAMREAIHAGVRMIASVHGSDAEDVIRRPGMASLLDGGGFTRVVTLRRTARQWQRKVYDGKLRALQPSIVANVQGGGGYHV